jgi:hypothetical protein
MGNWGIIVVGKLPKLGEVDEIVRHNEASNSETPIYGTNSVRSNDSPNSKLVQGINVCEIIHLMRRNGMMQTVTR